MARKTTEEEANFKIGMPKYADQWPSWLDGDIWALTPGEDFVESVPTFRAHCYYMARQYELTMRTRFSNGVLYLQATPRPVPFDEP